MDTGSILGMVIGIIACFIMFGLVKTLKKKINLMSWGSIALVITMGTICFMTWIMMAVAYYHTTSNGMICLFLCCSAASAWLGFEFGFVLIRSIFFRKE